MVIELSSLSKSLNFLIVASIVGVGQTFERLVDVFALEGRDFTELKADLVSKGLTILGIDSLSGLEVNLVSNDNTIELALGVLLLDAFVPDAEELE